MTHNTNTNAMDTISQTGRSEKPETKLLQAILRKDVLRRLRVAAAKRSVTPSVILTELIEGNLPEVPAEEAA